MQFDYRYKGASQVDNGRADRTDMSFAPDTRREPTFFHGEIAQALPFREAISALHDVVISDLRFKPKDKTAYKAWAEQNLGRDWQQAAALRAEVRERIARMQAELDDLVRRSVNRRSDYQKAVQRYFNYLYQKERDVWFVLDPVITVHPDEISFECFSQDEATYGRLAARHEVFRSVGELACGTTNIDYSAALYDEFQKIRSYKSTRLVVDPSGFDVATSGEADFREVKIDLPDSWVRGFLQVSSAMSLPATTLTLHPMDVHNLCLFLRRHKEQTGPRSLRYLLTPGQPVRVLLEPFGVTLDCPRSVYEGKTAQEIRTWGRRRLFILERLIPIARSFRVHLLGTGMPSFYVADLGPLCFTLGLSGWTANDWSRAGNFDLLAPRAEVDELTRRRVWNALRQEWRATPDALAQKVGLDRATVLGALGAYTQAGRAIFDLSQGVYRARELSREPLPMEKLRFSSPQEDAANRLASARGAVKLQTPRPLPGGGVALAGQIKDPARSGQAAQATASLTIDGDERIIQAECTCNFFRQNRLRKGPCEHVLALRMAQRRQAAS